MQKSKPELNEVQQKAVKHGNGPLLIAAGAGSGKTRTLTSRLIYLLDSGIKPENIIAITFTNKAANEMRSRISNSQLPIPNYQFPFVGTFHSLGARILKKWGEKVGRNDQFTIFDDEDSLGIIKNILKEMDISKDRYNPLAIMSKISKIKNELIDPEELKSENAYDKITMAVFEKYEDTLKKSNAFDFDDLIEKVVGILQKNKEILEEYRNKWEHILVDEFQDVNTSQYALIKLLSEKYKNLFVIGDDQQSIYAFRGSDFRIFLNFEKDWPGSAIIKLEENYRSTQNIIRAASQLIKNNKFQKPKNLWTKNPEGSLIFITAFEEKESEAWGVAEKIVQLLQKNELPQNIAIIYRTNAQSRAIEQALIRLNVPYEIFGGLKFYQRKEIKDMIAGLRYAFNPKDVASIERLSKNFSKAKNEIILKELPRLKNELSIAELIKYFIEQTDYVEYLEKNFKNPDERRENIKELISFASTFNNAHDFLEQVALMSAIDGRPKLKKEAINPVRNSPPNESSGPRLRAGAVSNGVKLMTIHLAKGLEFDHVFLIGTSDGLLPHEKSLQKSDDLEEERRLMYVAMTRAKQNLNLSFYGLPSRFLGELPPELIEFKQATNRGEEPRDWDDETIYIE